MKTTTPPCPEPVELEQLLAGSLSDGRQQECMSHLEACSCCQSKLENIATDGTNLPQVVQSLHQAEPAATSAYWPVLEALDTPSAQVVASTPIVRSHNVSLSFLQPATDTAYLGRLAHFDVMRIIGRGGMGLVLEAFDTRLQRNVAIKVLDPDLASDETAGQRFCREARAAASITHENVVAVHQVEKAAGDGLPYLVMQLVAGETLEQRLTSIKTLPVLEIVRIGMQAAHGLAAAHAQGLIHRDIKPSNILLEPPHDRVLLTDFGLARVSEDVKLTRTGFVTGTPLYMAPEQALGAEADPRSDLFSLGAILYEMCAGQPPFNGNSTLAIMRQIAEAKHRPLRELNPQVPEWLSETIDRLLAKKADDRFQSAIHLAELLDFQWALMKTTSDDVPTVCVIEKRKRTIRNRWIAAIGAVVFLGIGLLAGMALVPYGTASLEAISTAEPMSVLTANAGAVWSVAFDPSSPTVAMAVEDGTVRLWDLPTRSVTETINAHRGNIWSVQFAPSGDTFATAGDEGAIHLWRLSQATPQATFERPNAVRGLTFSHDGQRLFSGDRAGGVRVWSIETMKPIAEAQSPSGVYAVAVSANDKTLATAGSDKVVRLWNAATLSQRLLLEGHSGPVYSLSFHPDGKRLASAGWDKTVRLWDVDSGGLVKSWHGHDGDIWGIAFSPDGSRLATGGTDGAVKVWNAATGELIATYLGHKTGVHTVAFNRDGSLLASGGRDGSVRIWQQP
ncbi:MAG TPA: serine/threonine-protein kinase [Pirellulales bacterium]|jgi:hypothetical protein|nr:serine/threonine-protein kinase [Pirellulales bacterium]